MSKLKGVQLTLDLTVAEEFKSCDRVRCPDGIGLVYWINDYVWVVIGNCARPYEKEVVSHANG